MRRPFRYVPGQHRPRTVRNGAILVLVVAFVLVSGFGRGVPLWPDGRTTVTAELPRADSLRPGSPVRVAGVDVGEVTDIDLGPGGRGATVRMRIDRGQDVDLRHDARAHLYWRTLLGRNLYIELEPGSDARELRGTIPRSRTTAQVEVDQLLQVFDDGGRRSLRTVTREFERGFGRPADVRRAIDEAEPAAAAAAPGLSALRGRVNGELTTLVRHAARITGVLAREDDALAGLVRHGARTFAVTASRATDLRRLIAVAPTAQAQTRRTMRRLRGTLDRLDPLVDELRPGARRLDATVAALRPALDDARPLLRAARPTLQRLRPAVASLRDASADGRPLVAALNPTVDRSLATLVPWLGRRDDETRLENGWTIGPWFSGASAVASRFDVNGYVLRMQPGLGLRSLDSLPCQLLIADPTATAPVTCDALRRTLGGLLGAPVDRRQKEDRR
ncbi:MAG: MlaD family protein [Solirubrobacteraceae bacterium]